MPAPRFRLTFPISRVPYWAGKYQYGDGETERAIETKLAPAVRRAGAMTRDQFLTMCRWKSPRAIRRCERNTEARVAEVTAVAFAARDESLRIGALLSLDGVSWPTASVFLHFCHTDPYPILDFRALESLGVERGQVYSFEFWHAYVGFCRRLADKAGVSMRTLDRALWQHSAGRDKK